MIVQDVINAIRQNGFAKISGKFFLFEGATVGDNVYQPDEKVVGGCAIGQAAVNLNLNGAALYAELNRIHREVPDGREPRLGVYITILNDNTFMTLPEIADHLENELPDSIRLSELGGLEKTAKYTYITK